MFKPVGGGLMLLLVRPKHMECNLRTIRQAGACTTVKQVLLLGQDALIASYCLFPVQVVYLQVTSPYLWLSSKGCQ